MKTPDIQIQEARAALARALQRQRQFDTRVKIVFGGAVAGWMKKQPEAAKRFLAYAETLTIRPSDAEQFAQIRRELQGMIDAGGGGQHAVENAATQSDD